MATTNQAQNLASTLYFCIGAKVILTKNICQVIGLYNGSAGTIIDIVYNSSFKINKQTNENELIDVFE